jgi:hypothetical protein
MEDGDVRVKPALTFDYNPGMLETVRMMMFGYNTFIPCGC